MRAEEAVEKSSDGDVSAAETGQGVGRNDEKQGGCWAQFVEWLDAYQELGEGPGVADLQRSWGCPEQSYQGRI